MRRSTILIHDNVIYNTLLGIYIDGYGGDISAVDIYNNLIHDNTDTSIRIGSEDGTPTLSDMMFIIMFVTETISRSGNNFG